MANIGQIDVGMTLNAQDFGAELAQVKTEVRTFGGDLDRVGKLAKGFLGGFAVSRVGGFVVDIARSAASAEEAISSLGVVFGEQAGAVEQFSRSMADQFGISLNTMLDASGRVGSLFEASGLDSARVAEFSKNIGKLAVDYSRFKNTSVGVSLDKMISGLSGESEPLRQFGIFLTEDAVKVKALELGLGKLNGKLTEGEKIQARYALIMEKGAIAMGSAEREASGAAAKIEALSGAWDNLKISLGETVAPAVAETFKALTEVLNDARGLVESFNGGVEKLEDPRELLPDAWAGAAAAMAEVPEMSAEQLKKGIAEIQKLEREFLRNQFLQDSLPAFKDALKKSPLFESFTDLVKADKPKPRELGGFAGAAALGSRDWASTILASRFGGRGKDVVADNTKATATNTAEIARGVSVMTGKLEALTTERAPDWR